MSEAPRCRYCGTSLPGSGADVATGTARSGHTPDTRNGHTPDRGNGHAPGAVSGRPMATERALDSLYQEVRRIREIAEARPVETLPAEVRAVRGMPRAAGMPPAGSQPVTAPSAGTRTAEGAAGRAAGDDRRRIEELTREVQELRITVARLRGMAVPGAVRST